MYAYDVWVNWVDGLCKAYNIPEYHEWSKEDTVELMSQLPIFLVPEELYDAVENGFDPLPEELLKEAYRKASRQSTKTRVEYAMIITDGIRVIAVDTDGEDVPNNKSRLLSRQENIVRDTVEFVDPKVYGWEPVEALEVDKSLMGRVLTIENVHMYGLTRRERRMKEILIDCLFQLSCSKNIEEVRYWFTDLFPGMCEDPTLPTLTIDDMIEEMHDHLKEGWDEQHVEFGNNLAKYFDNYTDIWEDLMNIEKDKIGEK